MKIVNVEDFWHPEAGYQMNILAKYLIKMGNEVTMITSMPEKVPKYITSFFDCSNIIEKDKYYEKQYGMKTVRLPLKGFVSGRAIFSWKQLKKAIISENPDVLFVHSLNTLSAIKIFRSTLMDRYPVITDCHMTEMASVNRLKKVFEIIYRHHVTPILIEKNTQVIRIQDEPYVEKCLGLPLSQAPFVSVGSDTMLFKIDPEARKRLRNKLSIREDAFVVLYAGKLDEYKGGLFLAEAISKKFECNKDVVFLIVGQCVGEYGKRVEERLNKSENTIIRMPTQKYEDLAKVYQASDMAVFPRQCSLSFYDVQACGLPVVFEDNEVNVGRAKNNNAIIFKAGDEQKFRESIRRIIDMDETSLKKMQKNSVEFVNNEYSYSSIAEEYMRIISEVVADNQK